MLSLNFLWAFMLHNFSVKHILGNIKSVSDNPDIVYICLILKIRSIPKCKPRLYVLIEDYLDVDYLTVNLNISKCGSGCK